VLAGLGGDAAATPNGQAAYDDVLQALGVRRPPARSVTGRAVIIGRGRRAQRAGRTGTGIPVRLADRHTLRSPSMRPWLVRRAFVHASRFAAFAGIAGARIE
jgi:hypothetical protein